MKLNVWPFSFSVGTVAAVAFAICAFFVAIAPEATAAFLGYLLHIDLTKLGRAVTWGSFFAGFVTVGVGFALWASIVVWLYNRMV